MSSLDKPLSTPVASVATATRWDRLDAWLERIGERLNSILVKESRQALRSRQFLGTFLLLLIAGWAYSLWWIAVQGPQVSFAAQGWELFFAYYFGLSLALLVFVPYQAYTSLAGERQDRTFELVAITSLTPRQIVVGKLASAGLQMLIFLSAAAPFIALSYLLRGIDLATTLLIVVFLVLLSFLGTGIALFVATLTRERHWQTLLGVVLVVGLFFAFGSLLPVAYEILRFEPIDAQDPWVWIACLAMLTGGVGAFALVIQATAAQLTFEADNRSTGLRVIMVIHQAVFLGWMAWVYYAVERGHPEIIVTFAMLSGIYWWIMGTLMTAEATTWSRRVRRGLPQKLWSRAAFTLLMPGSGTGFLFLIASLLVVVLLVIVAVAWGILWRPQGLRRFWLNDDQVILFTIVGACYVIAYVGLGKKIVDSLRRVARFSLLLPLVVQGVLLAVGCGLTTLLQMYFGGDGRFQYSPLQFPNVFWTLAEIADSRTGFGGTAVAATVVVPLTALAVFLWNLPTILEELRQGRLPVPERIVAEEEALDRQRRAAERRSPWDEPQGH